MNIAGLKYFVRVAQSKSITKAAEELYITQPALSRHLQRLEKELGVRLFERERGKLTCQLTEAGKLCLHDAQQILRYADNMVNTIQTCISGEYGILDIGYCGTEGPWLYKLVGQIRNRCPNIEINAQNLSMAKLKQGLLDGNLDLAYLDTLHYKSAKKELDYLELHKGHTQIIVPKSHPLAVQKYVELRTLTQEHFIFWKREVYPEYYDWFCAACKQCGFTPNIICYDETEMIYGAIYSGSGFGIYNSAYPFSMDSKMFSLLDLYLDNGTYLGETGLLLTWNKKNNNPCLLTALKLAKAMLTSSNADSNGI